MRKSNWIFSWMRYLPLPEARLEFWFLPRVFLFWAVVKYMDLFILTIKGIPNFCKRFSGQPRGTLGLGKLPQSLLRAVIKRRISLSTDQHTENTRLPNAQALTGKAHSTPFLLRLRFLLSRGGRKVVRDNGRYNRADVCMNSQQLWPLAQQLQQAQARQHLGVHLGGGGHQISPFTEELSVFHSFWETGSCLFFFFFNDILPWKVNHIPKQMPSPEEAGWPKLDWTERERKKTQSWVDKEARGKGVDME